MALKVCSKCKQTKDISNFYFRKDASCFRNECKECLKKVSKKNYFKKWDENKIKHNVHYHTKRRYERVFKKYNITEAQYNSLLKKQNNTCAICKLPMKLYGSFKKVYLHVDHDHKTGKVRGLLCNCCNMGIGNLKDDINLLYNAIEYLKRNRKEVENVEG